MAKLPEIKKGERKWVMVTAYDFTMATLIDQAGVDMVLVGDSLAQVMLGYPTTLPVTMDEMCHHTKAVSRAIKSAWVIADMPFGSYHESVKSAKANAIRFVKECGAHAVKIESFSDNIDVVKAIVDIGIPVFGHIGLTPQSIYALGGYQVQGRTPEAVDKLFNLATRLQDAGCLGIVLELLPADLGKSITQHLKIPTIGIGSGPDCDGQVLVSTDLLGLNTHFKPKFLKRYAELAPVVTDAVRHYADDVRNGHYPTADHSYD